WLRRRSNIAWATDGADVHVDASTPLGIAALLWTPTCKVVLTDNIEAPRLAAEEPLQGWDIESHAWWESPSAPAGDYSTDYPEDAIAEVRFSLTAEEIPRLRRLGRDSSETMERVLKSVRPGWTEHDLAGELARDLLRQGIQCPVLLVAADERIALFRHPIP